MEITLSPDVEKLLQERVERGEYRSASEVVEEAVRLFLGTEEAEAELEALVQEDLASGRATPMTSEEWESLRREVQVRHIARLREFVDEGDKDFAEGRYREYTDETLPQLAEELKREAREERDAKARSDR